MNRYQTVIGIVINKKTTKESDVFVSLLTTNNGKIVALAKGAKTIKSSRLGSLQLANTIKAQIYQKDNFNWLSETQTIDSFLTPSTSLTQINLIFYFLEIVNSLIAENQHIEGVFEISQNIIKSIYQNKVISFIKYEIKFIATLGFGVPKEITTAFSNKEYKKTQNLLRQYFENITEKKFESTKLFR
ncbi:DNA repair protein RecO [Candidatus Shapirobacteria bacterium RIFOXYD1_FULL_38_32]|uniref:Repair protein RecO protein n=4 Tax=Patescibacteria group TaxID=1783273 RepID=A0A0G0MCB5_9BACT|nr:MAG: repair protein RecO protein [Candidatus Shapirobacteria bacterium GW2011_GWE2_38_30]KKQ90346.1 MAG: repair protein RecO protein [Candidatus Shapirobacteria bacterium GW2011_GWE1_38_92]OGJ05777.1 MAG: DNA repair protein RecO [Candidatus Nomurabacteria bacterium RIFOXYA1_FULL_35_17]OGL56991.1 MAG: DNA repair protein RecO [Candidatus Shapirobacteria bacterium RIFOXYB1_FULL_38_38]OGL57253.1 MAG: DNA repair protein RecO [Candidatus Shapirobacteria bacterium RIFOXYC1_FULL_38_24]OGL57948.1 MA